MKFALVNPAWEFSGSIYFGCQEAHYPLELLFGFDKIREARHRRGKTQAGFVSA